MKESGIWEVSECLDEHCFSLRFAWALGEVFERGKQIFDFGAGVGFYTNYLKQRGFECFGFEGTKDINEISLCKLNKIDLSYDYKATMKAQMLCLEVGEHIPELYEPILINNIIQNAESKIVLSWGIPGQGGFGHVNCKSNEYIIKKFQEKGWNLNNEQTNFLRENAGQSTWFENSVMVFEQ